jgi:inorganic pyrophosphatase
MPEKEPHKEAAAFQLQAFRKPKDIRLLRLENVSFSGSPRKHPYDPDKIILVADPYSENTIFYEFSKADVSHVEELPSVVDLEGNTYPMIRMWVKRNSLAIRSTPFITGDTRTAGE